MSDVIRITFDEARRRAMEIMLESDLARLEERKREAERWSCSDCAAKDAEIEWLQSRVIALEAQNKARSAALDTFGAEIERLRTEVEDAKAYARDFDKLSRMYGEVDRELDVIFDAAKMLRLNVLACWQIEEHELRRVLGNTNYNAVVGAMEAIDAAMEAGNDE